MINKKILFLTISFPNISQNTNMYTDLACEFKNNGNEVYVVAPSLSDKEEISLEGGINVLRVKSGKLFNVNSLIKGISNVRLPYQFSRAINRHFKNIKFDTVITPTPPITFYSTIKKIKKRDNCNSYLILRDIFPQNAKDLGLIKNPLVFGYFRKKEKMLYKISDYIGCMSHGNVDFIKKNNPDVCIDKFHLLPNWIKVKSNKKSKVDYKNKLGYEGKFIAIYGGNLGKPQQAEFIISLAEQVRYLSDVLFLIIGKGTEKNKLISLVREKGLTNVEIRDYLPRKEYQELVKQCDIGLVNLSDKFTIPNIPSRTLAYWEAKLPILAAVDKNTDYGLILEESKAGLCSITGDIKRYKSNFLNIYENTKLRKEMGENGYRYLVEELNVEEAYKTIIKHV